jgi:GNAT superfamily N-acetyltransferase
MGCAAGCLNPKADVDHGIEIVYMQAPPFAAGMPREPASNEMPMMSHDDLVVRAARAGDGQAVFDVTRRSIGGLGANHYSAEQISGWMGARTPAFYEDLIAKGRMVVAEREATIVAFVDAEPGEVTRLFILPDAAGMGLGSRLLKIGVEKARLGHEGPVKLEATLNAEGFYRRHGFKAIGRGRFSHGLGGESIEIVHMML